MTVQDYPEPAPSRPLWLMTLADLALLLVGFLVLVQATRHLDPHALARGLRARFDAAPEAPVPVAAAGLAGFAPGSAALPASPAALVAWAREASRDNRVTLTVTGVADGTAADVDPATRSPALVAADRARVAAAAIAAAVPAARLQLSTAVRPHQRAAVVTLAFTGPPPGAVR